MTNRRDQRLEKTEPNRPVDDAATNGLSAEPPKVAPTQAIPKRPIPSPPDHDRSTVVEVSAVEHVGATADGRSEYIHRADDPPRVTVVDVDRDDDIGSIRQKLALADSNRVALYISKVPPDLYNPVRIKLLKRYQRMEAKAMVVVTRDGTVRRLLADEDIRTTGSLRNIEKKFPRAGRGPLVNLEGFSAFSSVLATILVVLGIIALGIFGIVVVVPSASVSVAPVTTAASETIVVKASKLARGVTVETKTIAARGLTVDVEAMDEAKTTGRRTNADGKAKGRVTFTNTGSAAVPIKRGTLLRTVGDVRFSTDEDATVEPNRSVTVGVTAVEGGTIGNVAPAQITTFVEQEMASIARLSMSNPAKTEGGTQTAGGFVTAEDRGKLLASAIEKARTLGYARLYETKTESESIYRESVVVTPSEQRFSHFVDDPAESLSISLLAKASAIAFDSGHLQELGQKYAVSLLSAGQQVVPNSLEIVPLGLVAQDEESVSFHVMVKYQVMPAMDPNEVAKAITGMSESQAQAYLSQNLAMTRPADITVTPPLFGTMPRLSNRIEVRIVP